MMLTGDFPTGGGCTPEGTSALVRVKPFSLRTFEQWLSASEATKKAPFSVFVERTRESSSYTGFEDDVALRATTLASSMKH